MSNEKDNSLPQEPLDAEETGPVPAEESAGEPPVAARDTDAAEPAAESAEDAAEALRRELDAEKDKYLRLLAEYDNYRRRSARERDSIYADVKADTLLKLLPVYDNLERALAQETEDLAFRKGVEMTLAQFTQTLEALGVTPIEALGQTFDPSLHNAVMHIEDPEKGENEIVLELQKGFKLGDKVIRFSMVQVAN